ncbi:hypothetical protein B0I35DRAFT_427533 [Stachybotrys elegans]|uniref:AAA+ ATPase domain-containing protein n=1 Tax=Stachybotrys elegans TaxID=80388 RepID=A0A8K0SRE2_9HYPO|nr:hypothetical protein B0I35DRAFT_427533 [Stachybotrys elegans]
MARTSQTKRNGPKKPMDREMANKFANKLAGMGPRRPNRETELELAALQKEAERRQKILADQRRVASKWRAKIPQVRKANFEHFKNRFQDIDEPDYAIDVLMAGPGFNSQVRREQGCRRREELARMREKYLHKYIFSGGDDPREVRRRTEPARRDKRSEVLAPTDTEMQRIRIQSQPILGHLTALMNDTDNRSTPRTFMRPFKPLVYFQPKMREILATLEEKWADFDEFDPEAELVEQEEVESEPAEVEVEAEEGEEGSDVSDDDDVESLQSVDSNADEDFVTAMDSPEALRDMRCYVKFIDEEVMPLYAAFDGSSADKVKFEDLWCLYRPGDLIYMPVAGEAGGRYHEVWRVYKVAEPEPDSEKDAAAAFGWFDDDFGGSDDKSAFKIGAYYIDNDGNNFGAVARTFEVPSFVGERQITSLEVYPIRYRENHDQLIGKLKTQGQRFTDYLEDRHQQYSAWSLTRNPPSRRTTPEEEILENEDYQKMRHPEFVESDVIVDLTEAYQKMPSWMPVFHQLTLNKSVKCETAEDELPIQHWFDDGRQSLAYQQAEIVQKADGVERRQRRDNLNQDTFLRCRVKGSRTFETNPAALKLRDEDLVLLPRRMFAYTLRERRFLPIDLNMLKPVPREPGVFENLRIQPDYKDVVRGLVMSHFQKKELERRYADSSTKGPSQDLIQGKGRGLVVLLHGVPGVGKTATAEAVAMENRKPLFVITCGDLGLSPREVEYSLQHVFRLAHLWDCVLLLDEADVFLAQRAQSDMKRNALVSVFLRVLEYYNGLLFLTTNRVGAIDEAFKSRIHLSLYYPPLDKTQTRDIFRLNVAKLRETEAERCRMTGEPPLVIKDDEILEFATQHYEEMARSTGCWNGRQIRSAFQIASSLALHAYVKDSELARQRGQLPPAAPVLGRALFDKVQMSTTSFDRHMKKESALYDNELPMRGTFQGER